MSPPEKSPPPVPAKLRSNQVPWGSPKPAAKAPEPAPGAPNLSAKEVPWASRKTPPPAPPVDPMVTHMPWAEPEPRPALPVVPAKKIPWFSRKSPKTAPPPEPTPPEPLASATSSWALPKAAEAEKNRAASAQVEMGFAREPRPPDDEPTAEQLVALLSRLTSRSREPRAEPTPMAPYKARPISFEPTRWEIFLMWAHDHRRPLGIAGALFALALVTAYLLNLVALNAEIDRQWLQLDQALRDRYAATPTYVKCLASFTDGEQFTVALTQRSLAAWGTAHTEEQVVNAAANMEQALALLSKAIKRQEQAAPAMDPDQRESAMEFARLEQQREQSRLSAKTIAQRYNATVARYNDRVLGAPGSWIAGLAHLEARTPIFGGYRG